MNRRVVLLDSEVLAVPGDFERILIHEIFILRGGGYPMRRAKAGRTWFARKSPQKFPAS